MKEDSLELVFDLGKNEFYKFPINHDDPMTISFADGFVNVTHEKPPKSKESIPWIKIKKLFISEC